MATSASSRATPSTSSVTTTLTIENNSAAASSSSRAQEALVLELRPRKKKVTWKEGTVDNEFMNKKSSKICCIYHKEKPFDETTATMIVTVIIAIHPTTAIPRRMAAGPAQVIAPNFCFEILVYALYYGCNEKI
ncbi:Stabilizer of iron transporter SufD / Polynucleotidyl transferase isoform 1 [Hibiscus syriacus]|uniref:Stabilizer of iron transporter SufD / Polynucleotidyl transferase isoform 1 n=1 Tax=Hibiscus syriacus TaxID=106335 RepID=A0A6A3B301_HIBSY|nr:Stabilizer of iron transporter SufD / Polynucleotidyl transferase isoform 1 [Hibiscus syriacus]